MLSKGVNRKDQGLTITKITIKRYGAMNEIIFLLIRKSNSSSKQKKNQ